MTSLESIHRDTGARIASYDGVESPADFGSVDDEHRALRESCGLLHRSWTSGLRMEGADRVRFLNGLVTCDVASLAEGDGTYGFITQVKGRILADVRILAAGERLCLELPAGKSEEIAEHLGKYVIVDQVEVLPLEEVPLALIGPGSAEVLGQLELPGPVHGHARADLFGIDVRLVRDADYGGVPSWTLWAPAGAVADLWAKLAASGGVRAAGREAWDRLRVEAGRPLFGRDFGPENFPQETGLEEAVSYTKGCYLGQEVVARIHYRGGVVKLLRGLRFSGAAEPLGESLVHEGREAGLVTSAARSPVHGHVGLAILHVRAEPGERLDLSNGGTADVVALPFEPLQ